MNIEAKHGIIYKATNVVNNKSYIGQTIGSLKQRIRSHKQRTFCKKGQPSDYLFHRAIRKCGIDSFKWEIVELCDTSLLNEKEIYYIKLFKTYAPEFKNGYNMTRGGDSYFGSSGEYHYLNQMSDEDKKYWIEKYRLGRNNPNFGNGENLNGSNHFTRKMTQKEYDSWVKHFSGENNYQKRMTKQQLKNKSHLNKMSIEAKKLWIDKNLMGENNPFFKAVVNNPEKYRGKNHPCFGKVYVERQKKYILTHPDGKEEVITKLVEFCKNHPHITPYGLRLVLNKKVDSYRGYRLRYSEQTEIHSTES